MTSSRLEERKAGVDYEMMTARHSAQMAIRQAVKYIMDQGLQSCIKSNNIPEATTLTEATEYLSDEGAKVGRTVETGSILMTCIAGSLRSIGNVAIVDRKVAFNQQINAIVPKKQNTYFMYEQFRLSKDYICSGINMALKGILSKGQLSEIEFVFPPLALQNEFAAFAQQADKSEFLLRQLLEKQQTLKKALMQEYFS